MRSSSTSPAATPDDTASPVENQGRGQITDVPGISVGHHTDLEHATGCTAVLVDHPAVGGVDVRGAAPGSRDTGFLHPLATIEHCHGIMLAGGSAFGLEAATGVLRYLEEQGRGMKFGRAVIPLVPSAIIFDLGLITHLVRPTAEDGYSAAKRAGPEFRLGTVGAGTGATIGKLRGMDRAVKGGVGTASVSLGDGIFVGALVVMNAVGSVIDPDTGAVIAGPRTGPESGETGETRGFENTLDVLIDNPPHMRDLLGVRNTANTVIGVVATNAGLDKKAANRLAGAGQDAITMTVRPAHMAGDGDTIFALATGAHPSVSGETAIAGIEDRLRAAAMRAMVAAILSSVENATGLGGVPSAAEHMARTSGRPDSERADRG